MPISAGLTPHQPAHAGPHPYFLLSAAYDGLSLHPAGHHNHHHHQAFLPVVNTATPCPTISPAASGSSSSKVHNANPGHNHLSPVSSTSSNSPSLTRHFQWRRACTQEELTQICPDSGTTAIPQPPLLQLAPAMPAASLATLTPSPSSSSSTSSSPGGQSSPWHAPLDPTTSLLWARLQSATAAALALSPLDARGSPSAWSPARSDVSKDGEYTDVIVCLLSVQVQLAGFSHAAFVS